MERPAANRHKPRHKPRRKPRRKPRHKPLKILHTSDWQLGLRLNFVGGDAAVRLRTQRFDTVRRIGELARERGVDVVLVAGDVFDDNGVGADTLQQARDALEAFGDVPVVLLPGNHDPATADSALRRLGRFRGSVHVALERQPMVFGAEGGAVGASSGGRSLQGIRDREIAPTMGEGIRDREIAPTMGEGIRDREIAPTGEEGIRDREIAPTGEVSFEVFPCPLLARHHYDDPAAWLPARGDSRAVRIALAHGGALSFGESTESPNRIDVESILERGFDYVALGDWHGLYEVGPRAWYSGAPEATRFKEKRPGHVLLVEIDAPGATPRVEAIPVARSRWLSESIELHDDAGLEGLARRLDELAEKSWTLLALTLSGQLSLAARARLDGLLEDYGSRLAHLRLDSDGVAAVPSEADLETLHGEGYLGRAIARLREGDERADADALRLLYRLLTETA